MPNFNTTNALLNYLKSSVIPDVLQNEAKEEIVDVSIKHNESDIYSYDPQEYIRRHTLTDRNNFVDEMINDSTIKIYNNAKPSPAVVEGYSSEDYQLQWLVEEGASPVPFGEGFWTKERPAVANTFEELDSSKSYVDAFKRGLKRRGIDIK